MVSRKSLFVIATLITISLLVLLVVSGTRAAPPNSGMAQPALAQVILEPTAMAWVSSAEPNANFGGLGYVWVGYGQGTGAACCSTLRGLVKFDLSSIPRGVVVTSARLYATIWGAQGPPDHFVYYVDVVHPLDAWDEATVTWNNRPDLQWNAGSLDISATAGQVSWDVRTYVQRWSDGTLVDRGLLLSRENDTTDPQEHTRLFGLLQLVVNYEIPTPTPTTQPLVTIAKTDWADPVYAGDEVQYTISLHNLTSSALSNLVLRDTIPVGTTYVEGSSGASFDGNRTVTWRIPSLGVGYFQSVNLTLRTSPRAPDGTVLTNQATIFYPCPTGICRQEATQTTTVLRRPTPTPTTVTCPPDEGGYNFNTATDLPLDSEITAYICPAGDEDWFKFPVSAGDTIDGLLYNLPADYAVYLVRPDGVPVGTFDEDGLADEHIKWWGITPAQAGEWRVCVFGPGGAYSAQPYSLWMTVRLPTPTPTRTYTPTPTRTPTRTPTGTRTPTSTPTSTPTRTPTSTPTNTPTRTSTPAPNFRIDPFTLTSPVVAGQTLSIKATVSNLGPGRAQNVRVSVRLDSKLKNPVPVNPPGGVYDSNTRTVTWTWGDAAPNSWDAFYVDATVDSALAAGTVLHANWTVKASGMPDTTKDQTITVNQARPAPSVHLSHTLSPHTVAPGDSATWSATVSQNSSYPLTNFKLTFKAPSGLTFSNLASNCSPHATNNWVICTLNGAIGSEQTKSVTIGVPVSSGPCEKDLTIEVMADEMLSPQSYSDVLKIGTDLTIDGIEITQSIQDYPSNSVRLLQNRKTWIRVYPVSSEGTVRDVGCVLRVYRCTDSDCSQKILDLTPLVDQNGVTTRNVGTTYDRGDGTQGFFFGLPTDQADGRLAFEAEINPSRSIVETNYANNKAPRQTKDFLPSMSTGFYWVQGQYQDANGTWYLARASSLDDDVQWMAGALPFRGASNLGLAPVEMLVVNRWDFTVDAGWDQSLARLAELHDDCEGDVRCNLPWVLALPPFPASYGSLKWGGVAYVPGRDVVADPTIQAFVVGHELGHSYGLYHAPSVLPDCSTPEDIDWNIPTHLEDYGLDVETLWIYPPETTADFMSYCPHVWPTIYTYNAIYDHFYLAQAQATAAATTERQPGLLVTGVLSPTENSGAFRRIDLYQWPDGPFDQPGTGPYSLELRNAAETVLFTRHFTSTPSIAEGGRVVTEGFKEILPPQAGMRSIVLKHGATTLATQLISANPPTVTLLAPNGGETITAPFQAQWQATDADGDPLTFALQISRDSGQSWWPITRGLTQTTYILDPAQLPGGAHLRLRVLAHDGVRTSGDASDVDFSATNNPPAVQIIRPPDGSSFQAGQPVFLLARAFDREDTNIAEQTQWQSDRDGSLGTGGEIATRSLSVGTHTITASVTDSGGLTASDSISLTITAPVPPPDQCTEWLVDGNFEMPGWAAWAHGGTPEPVITLSDTPTPTNVLLLAPPGSDDVPGLSWARQTVTLPTATGTARLTFRYRTGSRDADSERDWFVAAITGSEGEPVRALRRHGGQSDWQTVEADLTEYAGQTIGILFAVRNDGQAGQTWAEVDDVSLCVSAAPPVGPPLGACSLPEGLADYAPAGLPDFDQRQADWLAPGTTRWSHDGPVAMADLLWWRDSATETGATPPPDVSDGYALVESYGPWDDHDPQNVAPLVEDLAARMNTNADGLGADLDDLVTGLNAYLAEKGLTDDYTVTVRRSPSFDWVRDAAKQNEQVLLLLGFWELQPGGWKRLGGHYVAVAGVDCNGDGVALSDPARNSAEFGWPGHVAPPGWHGHPPEPPDTLHNNATYVSHDSYGIMRTTTGWGPQGYARRFDEIADFAGLNFAPALEASRASAYSGGEILTLADYALVLAPQRSAAILRLTPGYSRVRGSEIFAVEIEADAGTKSIDRAQAFVDFDPTILRVVDESGAPATQIVPGTALTNVLVNSADNTTGRIGFVAQGTAQTGRFTVAVARFQVISPTLTSRLAFSVVAPRGSDLLLGGESVLEGLRGGLVTALPGARITGQATMQGRPTPPDAAWSVPLLLTLGQPGERGPAYAFGTVSDQNGAFTMPGIAAPGDYRVRLKGLHTLRNLLPMALTGGANSVNMETLLEGDAFGDNRVDGRDVSLLTTAFGKAQGQTGFDPRADFNEDDVVNQADLNLLKPNLGRRGDILLGVTVASAAGEESPLILDFEPRATGPVSLGIVPSSALAAVGQVIALDVVADAGIQPVDTVELYLDFDPAMLQAVDASGVPATAVQPGTALATILFNRVDPAWGWVDYLASSAGGTAPSGQFIVATLRLKVLQAGQTWVRFSFSDWRPTDVTYQAQSVLGSVEAAQVQTTARYDIYLPVIMKQYHP